jgi:hypothetical protein
MDRNADDDISENTVELSPEELKMRFNESAYLYSVDMKEIK